jgi:carbamoyltransferase
MSYTLGLSFGFHDAAAALAQNGTIISYAAEERFTRQKHDRNFPKYAIDHCLQEAGITTQDLEAVAYHESPEQTFSRVLTSSLAGFPFSRREFSTSMKAWLSKKLWTRNEICRRLNLAPEKLICHQHHTSHAAQSFLASGLESSAILTIDAVGEWASTGLFLGDRRDASPIKLIKTFDYPHSLGLFYSTMTAFLGFIPMDGECSTMALAAFGKPVYAKKLREVLQVSASGYQLDQSYFNFDRFYKSPFSEKMITLLGLPRNYSEQLPFDCHERQKVSPNAQRFADIAASVQLVYEEAVLQLAKILHAMTGSKNLCLAGGGALNCVANKKIADSKIFERIFIAPDPGDGGAAVGAALLSSEASNVASPQLVWRPNSGKQVNARDLDFTELIDTNHSRRFSSIGVLQKKHLLKKTSFAHLEDLTEHLAKELHAEKIVGWCQGGFEAGPRALGNRSILIRPDRPELARRLSTMVKARAPYRPYALSLNFEEANNLLIDFDPELIPFRWMQLVCDVKPHQRDRVCSALHIDGSTRPQVVFPGDNQPFHQLLAQYGDLSGTAALLNTSFNESGYPIVTTAIEALAMFSRTGMDILVIENTMIEKIWETGSNAN